MPGAPDGSLSTDDEVPLGSMVPGLQPLRPGLHAQAVLARLSSLRLSPPSEDPRPLEQLLRSTLRRVIDAEACPEDGDALAAVGLIIAAGAQVDAEFENQVTLLHFLMGGDGKCSFALGKFPPPRRVQSLAQLLLCAGADLEARDGLHDATPLGWAAWYGSPGGARAMLVAGAELTARDVYGQTPEHWARHNEHPEVAAILQEAAEAKRREAPGGRGREASATAGGAPRKRSPEYHELAELADHLRDLCRRELRQILGPWAEEGHRMEAAARLAALAWGLAGRGAELPGTALELVARFHMEFPLWDAATVPRIPACRPRL